jgi:cobalt-zinc-cadmium efflux system membrane fusion protein
MDRDDEEIVHDERDQSDRRDRHRVRRKLTQGLLAVTLLGVGVAAGVVWSERRGSTAPPSRDGMAERASGSASAGGPMPGMPGMPAKGEAPAKSDEAAEITLTPEAVQRAGIKTAVVRTESATASITVPGTVMSNAYRDTKVNSLVGGIVRQVPVELGANVTRGQPLAVIFSAELADAQMKYLSMRAMLEADHQKLVRTEKLVAVGAASRQELEEVTATHSSHETEVAAARQRLVLLGLSPGAVANVTTASQVVSEVTIPSPANGLIIARNVNPGQVVGAAQELFIVTDLSSVWVIGDLYEKDFANVRVGSTTTITVPAARNLALRGRVTYIDPRVDPATRTAKVRIEVPNRDMSLRLGMYVNVSFETPGTGRQTLVPRDAVQSVGDRSVVYVSVDGDEGRFLERPVKLGPAVGESVEVLEGLKPGERVVVAGTFFLRGEAARSRSGG